MIAVETKWLLALMAAVAIDSFVCGVFFLGFVALDQNDTVSPTEIVPVRFVTMAPTEKPTFPKLVTATGQPTETSTPYPTDTQVPSATYTPVIIDTWTPVLTETPTVTWPTWTPEPTFTLPIVEPASSPFVVYPTAEGPSGCSCSGDIYNCGDFLGHNTAQECFNKCVSLGFGDIHRLDRDKDGIACEN